jgi:serine beta-lactamase-like protein LACTB, mitochondrial
MFDPDEILQLELASKAPGVSAAVAVDGKVVWSRQCGFSDIRAKAPVVAGTRIRIGSVSKPLTSAGLALLVERGKLDLDAPVQKYVPDFPDKGAVITPRMLAGHLSGIRNYSGTEAATNPPVLNLRAGLKVFETDPLESAPGTKYNYASYNWNVLGVVMESAANQEFLAFMAENVLRPLGLEDTVPDRSDARVPRRARCYEVGPSGEFLPAPRRDFSSLWPAGGFLSSAEDMVRFGSALMRPGFLKAESLDLLFTSQKTAAGKPTNYGLGWMTVRSLRLHGGDSMGGTAVLLTHPASRTVVAFAANCGQVLLRNAIARGKAPGESARFLFDKVSVAAKIARAFVPSLT